ncbi:MAG: alpha/beta hydrolase [Alphaproteobacteria bacterium]
MKDLNRFFEPEGWRTDFFTSTTGREIRYGHAAPEGDPKGTVVITTGYADFMEAYHETISEYLKRGYSVWMMDWAGHGGSEKTTAKSKKKGQTVEDHIEDLRKFREEIVKPEDGKPVFLSTHSMGGQVALHFLHQHPEDFNFAVLATPHVETKIKGPARDLLKLVFAAAISSGLADAPIEHGRQNITKALTAERKQLQDENPVRMTLHKTFMLLNENLKCEDPTVGYIESLLLSAEVSSQDWFLKGIKTPVLLGVSLDDDVVDNDAIRRAGKLIPQATVKEIEGGIHALWIDRDKPRQEWWQAIDAFITAQGAPPRPNLNPPQVKGP